MKTTTTHQPHTVRSILVGSVIVLLSLSAIAATHYVTESSVPPTAECASLARTVASRNHSMLEGRATRDTVQHAYQVCLNDPAAFRRIVR